MVELRWIASKRFWKDYIYSINLVVDFCKEDNIPPFSDKWEYQVYKLHDAQYCQVLSVIQFLRGVLAS